MPCTAKICQKSQEPHGCLKQEGLSGIPRGENGVTGTSLLGGDLEDAACPFDAGSTSMDLRLRLPLTLPSFLRHARSTSTHTFHMLYLDCRDKSDTHVHITQILQFQNPVDTIMFSCLMCSAEHHEINQVKLAAVMYVVCVKGMLQISLDVSRTLRAWPGASWRAAEARCC